MKKLHCTACTQGAGFCTGSNELADARMIADPGLCIEPLHDLYRISFRVAQFIHQKYASPESYHLCFHTQHTLTNPVQRTPAPYNIDGETEADDSTSIVRLVMNSRRFHFEDIFAIPYVLFHELVCHAFQGCVSPDGNRIGCPASDLFGEGWMDFVASEVLLDFLSGSMWPDLMPERDRLRHWPRYKEACEVFHAARKSSRDKTQYPHGGTFQIGSTTAERVRNLLGTLTEDGFRDAFYRLSIGLNVQRTTKTRRLTFMSKLIDMLDSPRGKESVKGLLRDYLRHESPGQFFDDVCASR